MADRVQVVVKKEDQESRQEAMETREEEIESSEEDLEILSMTDKDVFQKLNEYFKKMFVIIENSDVIDVLPIKRLIDIAIVKSWPIDFTRRVLDDICKNIFTLEEYEAKVYAKFMLEKLDLQALKFEEQFFFLREKLAAIYETEKKFLKAALLRGLNLSRFEKDDYLANHKLRDCLDIADLYIEANNLQEARNYINRAMHLQTNESSMCLKLRLKHVKAKFCEHMGNHLQAALRYFDLSGHASLPSVVCLEVLEKTMSCILASGYLMRSRDQNDQVTLQVRDVLGKIPEAANKLKRRIYLDELTLIFEVSIDDVENNGLRRILGKIKNLIYSHILKGLSKAYYDVKSLVVRARAIIDSIKKEELLKEDDSDE